MSKKEPKKESKKSTSKPKRKDKIYNNSWNTGENLKGDEYQFRNKIKVKDDYSSKFLKDLYEYEDHVEYKILLDEILEVVEKDKDLKFLFAANAETKKKFNSDQINVIFEKVYTFIQEDQKASKFLNSIYVLEAISSITGFDYKKIFDFLEFKYKSILLTDLDKKYKFLDGKMNISKMF